MVLLAHLLRRPNQVVTVDQLIEGLWGDGVPRTASNVLQAHVACLPGSSGGFGGRS